MTGVGGVSSSSSLDGVGSFCAGIFCLILDLVERCGCTGVLAKGVSSSSSADPFWEGVLLSLLAEAPPLGCLIFDLVDRTGGSGVLNITISSSSVSGGGGSLGGAGLLCLILDRVLLGVSGVLEVDSADDEVPSSAELIDDIASFLVFPLPLDMDASAA